MDIKAFLDRQVEFSYKTFGPGRNHIGIVDHIEKELAEIMENPTDVEEWVDVVILAFDGAWRAGHTPSEIQNALMSKLLKNESRKWPDWRTAEPNKAIEHIRE